jgi:aminoglycoside phosphotransferase
MVSVACETAGIQLVSPKLLRSGENNVWRVNESAVVRIGRLGQLHAVRREVNIAKWLEAEGFPAVRLLRGVEQPIEIDGRPVSYWAALPPHRQGTIEHVALLLRQLHSLQVPNKFDPGMLQPFVRLRERIGECIVVAPDERVWLLEHLSKLEAAWAGLPEGLPPCVVHGDAWVGNVAVDNAGHAVMLDLERAAVGPPEWDLVSTAIKVSSFGWATDLEYQQFVSIYGSDVTAWTGFELLRDIRELRMATYLLQRAGADPDLVADAQFRVGCLRGLHGRRPWQWRSSD